VEHLLFQHGHPTPSPHGQPRPCPSSGPPQVLFGAALSFWAFDRHLASGAKRLAVLLLYAGICAVQWSAHSHRCVDAHAAVGRAAVTAAAEMPSAEAALQFPETPVSVLGVGCAVLAALCSAGAGTYSEALLKGSRLPSICGRAPNVTSKEAAATGTAAVAPTAAVPAAAVPSLWLTNARLSLWGSLFGFVAVVLQDGRTIASGIARDAASGAASGGAASGAGLPLTLPLALPPVLGWVPGGAWRVCASTWGSFFRGYDARVLLLVAVQSAGGLVISGEDVLAGYQALSVSCQIRPPIWLLFLPLVHLSHCQHHNSPPAHASFAHPSSTFFY